MRELERSLPIQRPRREPRRFTLVAAGTAFATALAVLAIGLSLAGLLPFTSAGRGAGGPGLPTVVVERDQRVPHFVRDRAGVLHVQYRVERRPQLVRRCR